eukprot:TRINITY_DN1429_c3_g1_i1.p1 TRINITY_DN1429_c3_g1~~TRINITY_DN1429_c3_g1_i1.p1  ORF type:complete len:204 (+),score=44.65 TRINITY_DN1429_c3_g1_i1:62-673(+)
MVLGDFGNEATYGFGTCYDKTVDRPQHFRMKPKQVPKEMPTSWGFSAGQDKAPEYEKSARFSCRAADHSDILTSSKEGTGYGSNLPDKLSKKMLERPATVLVANQVIGGKSGTADPFESRPMTVGKKPLQGAAQKTVANICNPSKMPEVHVVNGRREAAFSSLHKMTIGDPDKYQKASKGKKQSSSRNQLTTGANQILQWGEQ